jgi:hypothetical protein
MSLQRLIMGRTEEDDELIDEYIEHMEKTRASPATRSTSSSGKTTTRRPKKCRGGTRTATRAKHDLPGAGLHQPVFDGITLGLVLAGGAPVPRNGG